MKIYLTNSAKSDLSKLLSDKNNKEYIRISKKKGNVWQGPIMDLALDKRNNDDSVYEVDNYKFIIKKQLELEFSVLYVNYIDNEYYTGYRIDTEMF